MKAHNELTLWSIIERIQRRLERTGMSPSAVDKVVALAIQRLVAAPVAAR